MPNNWKKYKLSEVGEIVGGGTPSTKNPEYFNGDIPWLTPRDLTGYPFKHIKKGERGITTLGLKNSGARLLPKGTVLMSSRAPIGYLVICENEVTTNQGFKSVICNERLLHNNFLFYFLKNSIEKLHSIATGTTFLEVSGAAIKDFEIELPPLPEQQAIAEILSSLDDKIELNLQTNKTLEEMANALYKQWFVDFGPFKKGEFVKSELGMIPEGWEVKRLDEFLTVKRGGSPRPIQDYLRPTGLPWVKISDATASDSPFLLSTQEFIREEGLNKTVLLSEGSLILSNSASPGIPKFLGLDACIHDGWLHFPEIKRLNKYILFLLFVKIKEHLISQGNGSVFTNLKTDILKSQLIALPPQKVETEFTSIITNWFHLIRENSLHNRSLKQTRDYLLPKLISGEIQVKEAAKKVKELI